jgi:ribosomal protein L35
MKTKTIKPKTRKSITKRFKVTKNGKVLRRAVGQDHLLAKQTGHKRRRLKKLVQMSEPEAKKILKLLAK